MAPTRGTKPRHHILSVMVENRSGVLARLYSGKPQTLQQKHSQQRRRNQLWNANRR